MNISSGARNLQPNHPFRRVFPDEKGDGTQSDSGGSTIDEDIDPPPRQKKTGVGQTEQGSTNADQPDEEMTFAEHLANAMKNPKPSEKMDHSDQTFISWRMPSFCPKKPWSRKSSTQSSQSSSGCRESD